jgi:hypothetical protein
MLAQLAIMPYDDDIIDWSNDDDDVPSEVDVSPPAYSRARSMSVDATQPILPAVGPIPDPRPRSAEPSLPSASTISNADEPTDPDVPTQVRTEHVTISDAPVIAPAPNTPVTDLDEELAVERAAREGLQVAIAGMARDKVRAEREITRLKKQMLETETKLASTEEQLAVIRTATQDIQPLLSQLLEAVASPVVPAKRTLGPEAEDANSARPTPVRPLSSRVHDPLLPGGDAERQDEPPTLLQRIEPSLDDDAASLPYLGSPVDMRVDAMANRLQQMPASFHRKHGLVRESDGQHFQRATVRAFILRRSLFYRSASLHVALASCKALIQVDRYKHYLYQHRLQPADRWKLTLDRIQLGLSTTTEEIFDHLISSGVGPEELRATIPGHLAALKNLIQECEGVRTGPKNLPPNIIESARRAIRHNANAYVPQSELWMSNRVKASADAFNNIQRTTLPSGV